VTARDEALRLTEEGYAATRALVGRLDDDAFARPATIGGGDWSAKDLLCHLAFWERNALEALEDWKADRPWRRSSMFDEPHGDDRLNAEADREFASVSADDARALAGHLHVRLVAEIHDLTDEQWVRGLPDGQTWGSGLGDILQGVDGAFRHAWAHLEDLRAFVGTR
jgi:hypothetical protein